MNTTLLCDALRECREYSQFIKALNTPFGHGMYRPCLAEGLSDGAFQLFCLTLSRDAADNKTAPYNRVLYICPEDKEASRLNDFLKECGVNSLFYPSRDFNFSSVVSSHDFEQDRLSVLSSLALSSSPMSICTTAEAALQATMPCDALLSLSTEIGAESELGLENFVLTLLEAGYARVNQVESVGQFAQRGGIVDVFAPGDMPLRVEFFGDEVDRIGYFDIITQRMCETAKSAVICPVRETVMTDETRRVVAAALSKQIARLKKTSKELAAETLSREKTELGETAFPEFCDKYIGLIYEKPATLMSYFDGIVAVHDFTVCKERHAACEKLLRDAVAEMLEAGECVLPSKNTFPWLEPWGAVAEKAYKMPSVFAEVFSRSYNDVKTGEIFDFSSRGKLPYASDVNSLAEDIAPYRENGYMCAVFCDGEAEEKNLFGELFERGLFPVYADSDGAPPSVEGSDIGGVFSSKKGKIQPVALINGAFPSGFELTRAKLCVFDFSSDMQTGKRSVSARVKRKRPKNSKEILNYQDLVEGDIVVHDIYGIGRYEGIENIRVDGVARDYIHIRYAGKDKLFVPVDSLNMVSKYVGGDDDAVGIKLSKMGSPDWSRSKSRAKKAARDMAKELIELYAKRRRTPGIAFDRDDSFSRQFADAFEYEETDSQLSAIADLTRDMEKPYPMDRMICGDVGYGKTEVAMRAAFKAVMSGYQVALLVPTTILAYQHYQTMTARFRGFPVSIDMLSRFRTNAQKSESLRKLRRGDTDIIVGTHRLISKDVEFKNLGLIIIDEEQRFGVAQKEKLKQLKTNADVLTLTATPIPRTLNMAMGGIIDMSLLDDIPGLRSPIQTYVMEHDDSVIAEAMRRELRRGGQVFYLHNRIDSIYSVAAKISEALPDARVAVGHGKLERDEMEDIWASLVRGDIDILVSTTIIETGVDVPNVNTLIIDNADRYGLSQLHQIRGRVGRSARKAYAYFTYPKSKVLNEIAEKRLRAIKEYASFGAGFKIAMRDMKIRGAGNLLGAEQHGHMESVGYDMYLKLLNEAVLEEEGKTPEPPRECTVSLKVDAYISKSYIPDSAQRMEMYKKIARISDSDDFDDIVDEFCDRFGDIPSPTLALCFISLARGLGAANDVTKIEQKGSELHIYTERRDPSYLSDAAALFGRGGAKISVGSSISLCVKIPRQKSPADFAAEAMEKIAGLSKKDGSDGLAAQPNE